MVQTAVIKVTNATIADLLRQYAAALTVEKADRFKIKAYRRAAETIEGLGADVVDMLRAGNDLRQLPGIGDAISQIITEIARSGKLERLERSISKLTPELAELATRPRLDAAKVTRVYKKLQIGGLAELKIALESGAIREELGSRMEFHIRQGLDERPRHLLWSVRDIVPKFEEFLRSIPGVTHASAVGSVRRKVETVGDLNFLVAGGTAARVFRAISKFGAVKSHQPRGKEEHAFELSSGMTIVVRWTKVTEWGWSFIAATGSATHGSDLEERAKQKKISWSPAGLRKRKVDLAEERSVYAALNLAFIPPELREGAGEIEAAAKDALPVLVEQSDIRGDLHMHTTASDGANSIAEMAAAAQDLGYEYIAIADHSQSLKITNGLTEARLLQHIRDIDRLNDKLSGIRILKGAEVDILETGKLDYTDKVLKHLDLAVCSIHSKFALNKQQQTDRLLRAIDNPYFTILGHATGRLLLKREGYELDMERVLDHIRDRSAFVEINSSPDRLDLSAENARQAKARGILVAINTDAHSTRELRFMSAGINQARRGWLEASSVLNTRSLKELTKLLARR